MPEIFRLHDRPARYGRAQLCDSLGRALSKARAYRSSWNIRVFLLQGEMAERSKALESGTYVSKSSPKGRGFESHFRHFILGTFKPSRDCRNP